MEGDHGLELTTRFKVEFGWRDVGTVVFTDGSTRLAFPPLTATAGVYRFWIERGPSRPEVYIGETMNLRRRVGQYRRGDKRQKTSKWVHDALVARLGEGAKITMHVMAGPLYSVDDADWVSTDLALKEQRLILENAALAVAFAEEVGDNERPVVLNKLAAGRDDDA